MPRQRRIEYEGAIYHVMSRGDRREDIVQGDADRELWIKTLGEASTKCDWQVHAYAAMLDEIGWSEADLRARRKCAPVKLQIAHRLRAETTLTLKRVAQRASAKKTGLPPRPHRYAKALQPGHSEFAVQIPALMNANTIQFHDGDTPILSTDVRTI